MVVRCLGVALVTRVLQVSHLWCLGEALGLRRTPRGTATTRTIIIITILLCNE